MCETDREREVDVVIHFRYLRVVKEARKNVSGAVSRPERMFFLQTFSYVSATVSQREEVDQKIFLLLCELHLTLII